VITYGQILQWDTKRIVTTLMITLVLQGNVYKQFAKDIVLNFLL